MGIGWVFALCSLIPLPLIACLLVAQTKGALVQVSADIHCSKAETLVTRACTCTCVYMSQLHGSCRQTHVFGVIAVAIIV